MNSLTIDRKIDRLTQYGERTRLIPASERIYTTNLILDLLKLDSYDGEFAFDEELDEKLQDGMYGDCLEEILSDLLSYAAEQGLIEDTQTQRDIFDTKLMNCLTPRPDTVIRNFYKDYEISPRKATDAYYEFSANTDYIRRYRLKKDLRWTVTTEYGDLELLISLSKPERDPGEIAKYGNKVSNGYPKCDLCCENEGFAGNYNHPARQNHRIIPLMLDGEAFSFQYSPYGYYNEHCIVLNNRHIPMVIDDAVFRKLVDFVDWAPHYFIGSNADLPYVGGSILSHEHFQGGAHVLPIMKAGTEKRIKLKSYPNTDCGILHWPVSTIRLTGESREEITGLCSLILKVWKTYEDASVGIIPYTDGEPHNTITPLLRKVGPRYDMYLMLRNNRTSYERPYGVFHTRPELFHIKREGIGIIDAPGLAILPSRLAGEMKMLYNIAVSGDSLKDHEEIKNHREWMEDLLKRHPEWTPGNLAEIMGNEIGLAFLQMLKDVGVFKDDETGRQAFWRFAEELIRRQET